MDPNIWSALPRDLIKHIARFADIDTRRAMGIKPGKLPPSNFKIPGKREYSGWENSIQFGDNVNLYVTEEGGVTWTFGTAYKSSYLTRSYLSRYNNEMSYAGHCADDTNTWRLHNGVHDQITCKTCQAWHMNDTELVRFIRNPRWVDEPRLNFPLMRKFLENHRLASIGEG